MQMTCFRSTSCVSVNFAKERNTDCISDGDAQSEQDLLGKQGVSENWHLHELSGLGLFAAIAALHALLELD